MTYTLLNGFAASEHQAAIFEAIANVRSGSLIVKSVAGSGKTTVIKNALRYMQAGAAVQGLAFNVEAANNLKTALSEVMEADGAARYKGVRMGTFHSVGMGAIRRYLNLPDAQVSVKSNKCRTLLRDRVQEDEFELYSSFVCKLVGLAKGEGIGCIQADSEDNWYRIIDHHGMYLDSVDATIERAVDLAQKLLALSNKRAQTGELDFDDQLYMVEMWNLRLWQNDIVFVDEAQDTNPIRRALVRRMLKPRGRVVAVGDPRQSIYGFTGASTDAMELIAAQFRTRELPLTVSYRCARSVVRQAQSWVEYIEPSSFADEGEVKHNVPLAEALATLQQSDAVLCRQTNPLVTLAYRIIASGRAARVAGKEIGEGLVNLIMLQRARGIDALIEKLNAWRDREVAKLLKKEDEAAAEGLRDRVECIMIIIKNLPETKRTIPGLVEHITTLFTDDKSSNALTLSTVHKAKGQEWNRVAILEPSLMPSKAARQDWQLQQEENLMYVAATRAKQTLLYLEG